MAATDDETGAPGTLEAFERLPKGRLALYLALDLYRRQETQNQTWTSDTDGPPSVERLFETMLRLVERADAAGPRPARTARRRGR